MINTKEPLQKPVFQHLVPVLVRETSRVLGFVPTAYTMFLRAGTYVLWTGGPAISLECVTQPRSFVNHGLKLVQYLAIVYNQVEINKRFNLKGFISVESQQRQYQAQWISIKPGAYKLYDLGIFGHFATGIWDTSSDYDRAHTKNEDYIDDSASMQKEGFNLSWCLKLSLDRFSSAYDYVDTDWLKLFHSSLAKRNTSDTPISATITEYPETNNLKVSLLGSVIEAGSSTQYPNSTLPNILQIMRLRDLQAGVYKFVLCIESQTKVYNIKVSLVLKD